MTPATKETPWYHKWWAAPALGAGALGAGYLADRLVNGGQLTSSLLNWAKPSGLPAGQPAPAANQPLPFHKAPINPDQALHHDLETNEANDIGEETDPNWAGARAAVNTTGLPLMGGHAIAEVLRRIAPVARFAGPAANAFGKISPVVAPVFDMAQGSNPVIAGGIRDMAQRHGVNMGDATSKLIGGGMGTAAGGLSMALAVPTMGIAPVATGVAMGTINDGLNHWQNGIDMQDAQNADTYRGVESLIAGIRNHDPIAQHAVQMQFPKLQNKPFVQNMGGPVKSIIDQRWGPPTHEDNTDTSLSAAGD